MSNLSSIYKDISQETLDLVQKLNKQKESTFIIPTRFISSENAQLAYLLNEYYNYGREEGIKKKYRSFFVNTRYEAFQGAIKLIRHNGLLKKRNTLLVIDPEDNMKFFVNPLNEEKEDDYLIPGLTYLKSLEEITNRVNQSMTIAGVVFVNTGGALSFSECSKVIKLCKAKGIITLWYDPEHTPGQEFSLHKLSELTDMVILGEPLTDYEIPFSLFSMIEEVHRPWTSPQTCLFHSSTYAGNKLAVIKAKNNILNRMELISGTGKMKEICNKIENSRDETIKYFADYVNPGMIKFYSIIGYDFICRKGSNSWLNIEDNLGGDRQVLDVVSGGGAAIRGHCQEDINTDVLQNHSLSVDYWALLSDKLKTLFEFPYVFPAVSGATAVEIGLILSLLASNNKKRIIVFKDNFAGNTLVSLIGTANKVFHKAFQPIYKYVTYLDPFTQNAEQTLKLELEKGDVGLIWMELLQGGTLQEIPGNLLEIIQSNKDRYGYYIGVDEILMGFYRIDELASYKNTVLKPDVITFSKVLADGTYPMAATLVSDKIYHEANNNNPEVVTIFENLYKNQFGSHIALHSIDKLLSSENVAKIKNTSKILKEGLNQIQKKHPFIKAVSGKGHIYRLCYKNSFLSMYFCKKAIQEENLFIYIDRLVPAVTISEKDAKELIVRLDKLYSGVGSSFIFKVKSIFISMSIIRKLLF